MKKLLVFVLTFVIMTSFASCKKQPEAPTHTVDVEYHAKLGKIPEVQFALHTSENEITEYYGDGITINDGDHDHFIQLNRTEGQLAVRLEAGNMLFYYEKEKMQNGISVIVSFDTAYDFEIGISMPDDVKNAVGPNGVLSEATAEQLFFLPFVEGGAKVLTYNYDNYRLQFFFINDFLSATVLTDTNNWTD